MARSANLEEFETIFRSSLLPSTELKPFQISRLLVVVDSEGNASRRDSVLAVAAHIACAHEAEVRLISPVRRLKRESTRSTDRAIALLDECAHGLWQQGVKLTHDVMEGSPAALILEETQKYNPAITIMATLYGEDDNLEGFTLGSVADRVLAALRLPILLIERPVENPGAILENLLVYVEHERSGPLCLDAAVTLARQQAEITLYHVLDQEVLSTYRHGIEMADQLDTDKVTEAITGALCSRMTSYLRGAQQALDKAGYRSSALVEVGDPIDMVRSRIREGGQRLLVCHRAAPDQKLVQSLAYNLAVYLREIPLLMV